MRNGMIKPGDPSATIYPVNEKDAALMHIPHFRPFEPAAAIAGMATGFVDEVVSWMDFICTKIGFTSETVGFPATAGRFRVQVEDIGASRNFQNEAWNITALIGTNSGFADAAAVDMPVPWPFLEKTTIRVTFENLTALACTPHLLLIGYLTNWERDVAAAQAREALALEAQKLAASGQRW